MANSDENKQALVKHTKLFNNYYEQPVVENFWDCTCRILVLAGIIRVDDNSDSSSDESDVS